MIVVGNQKKAVGDRLKKARTELFLTQKELFTLSGIPVPSLQDYEAGKRMPGGDAVSALIRFGINANWLLTGEGPMLLADLEKPEPLPLLNKINEGALAAVIQGYLISYPDAKPERAAGLIASIYKGLIDRGEITPDGVGTGDPNARAA
ncbi:helix-turn-helix domain-containing protein [Propionivibrio sp.]|uniref:helix-turn-helix domain-containing protein n=1 Tax=Propionivibrio sp. TaxID=2212460 RepID=UPI003BF275AA